MDRVEKLRILAEAVDRVIDARRHRALTLGDLRALKAAINRAAPFVVTVDHTPRGLDEARLEERVVGRQLPLFGGAPG